MAVISYWDLNKEKLVNSAIQSYVVSNGLSGGYDILRFAEKGVISAEGYSVAELQNWRDNGLGYEILRATKAGKVKSYCIYTKSD